jgi:hypothetical protein
MIWNCYIKSEVVLTVSQESADETETEGGVTWWRMGKSTRVRSPSEAAGSASRDGAATAAALRPRLEEEDLTKPLPIAEPGKQQRSAAAAAMRAVAGLWERRGEPVASACRLCPVLAPDLGPPRQGQAMASAEGCATDRWPSSSNRKKSKLKLWILEHITH